MTPKFRLAIATMIIAAAGGGAVALSRPGTEAAPRPPSAIRSASSGSEAWLDPSYLRGAFASTSAEEAKAAKKIEAYENSCMEAASEEMRARVKQAGFAADKISTQPYRDAWCDRVVYFSLLARSYSSWTRFVSDLHMASQIASAYVLALHHRSRADGPAKSLRQQLRLRAALDSALRQGSIEQNLSTMPSNESIRSLVAQLLDLASRENDRANRLFLEESVLSESAQSLASTLDKQAKEDAWLLVQHSDADPALQARALRTFKVFARGDPRLRSDYAMLWDRVHLKLEGVQLFGSQARCLGGRRTFAGRLLKPSTVDRRRNSMGLPPVASNMSRMDREYGSCSR